jgi:hypothetical protein
MRRLLILTLLATGALIASSAVVSAPSRGRLAGVSGAAWAAVNYNSSKSNSGNVAKGKGGGTAGGKSAKPKR